MTKHTSRRPLAAVVSTCALVGLLQTQAQAQHANDHMKHGHAHQAQHTQDHHHGHSHQQPNTLTKAEVAAGWKLLFDGTSTSALRGFKSPTFPAKGWKVEDGVLRHAAGGGGGDIITVDQYEDFELAVEFKCAPGANSGIMYRVSEGDEWTWKTGPEYQILDDAGHKDGADPKHAVGSLYDLIAAPADKPVAKAGEWNRARIRLKDGVLQHFLNDKKVVEVRIDNPAWREMIAKSKFKDMPGFGLEPRGHIAFQDHGDDVSYRNMKIRDLDQPMPGEVKLFAGETLQGWKAHLDGKKQDGSAYALADVWSIKDGVMVCKGNPAGYIRTTSTYESFVLKLDWRFSPVTKQAGNSGVLFRMQEPDKVWPKSIEAQLMSGRAGDFWTIDEYQLSTEPSRRNGRNTKHTHAAEREVGEWNEYEIIVDGEHVRLRVNGEELNHGWGAAIMPGYIALQSEGAEIHFRNVRLAPIQ